MQKKRVKRKRGKIRGETGEVWGGKGLNGNFGAVGLALGNIKSKPVM